MPPVVKQRAPRIAVIGVLLLAVPAVATPRALAASALAGARATVACPDASLPMQRYNSTTRAEEVVSVRVKFVLRRVSCSKGHRLMRWYYGRILDPKACVSRGTTCILDYPGGWACSVFFATEVKQTGGSVGGCARDGNHKVAVRPVSHASVAPYGVIHADQRLVATFAPASSALGTAIEHSRSCGNGISAGQHTRCAFARAVKRAWYRHPRSIERVYSPVTRRTYAMQCQAGLGHVRCLGPHGLFASFPNIGFGP
jgi:hypothetical protein